MGSGKNRWWVGWLVGWLVGCLGIGRMTGWVLVGSLMSPRDRII